MDGYIITHRDQHTQQCLEYADSTGKNFCISSCHDERQKKVDEEFAKSLKVGDRVQTKSTSHRRGTGIVTEIVRDEEDESIVDVLLHFHECRDGEEFDVKDLEADPNSVVKQEPDSILTTIDTLIEVQQDSIRRHKELLEPLTRQTGLEASAGRSYHDREIAKYEHTRGTLERLRRLITNGDRECTQCGAFASRSTTCTICGSETGERSVTTCRLA